MSAPQQKPKRERKEGKKRQRANGSAAGTGASSPRAVAGNAFTIPKRKKEGKRNKGSKEEGGPKSSPRIVKQEEKEENFPQHEVTVAAATGGGGSGGNSANRMVNAPQKANISPRVGLGLADATDEMSAMRYHQDLSGGCRNNDRNAAKSIMSLAVAAASVAASEAAIAAAAAAAAAASAPPAPAPAPPKALGLKKLIHQRVQHDEANSNSAFSPKKLLKHRLLAAQQTPVSQPTPSSAPVAPSAGMAGGGVTGGYTDGTGNSTYAGQGGHGRAPLASGVGRFDNGGVGARSDLGGGAYGMESRGGSGVLDGGGRDGGGYDERDRAAAEGVLKCRTVGAGGEHNRRRATGVMHDDANSPGFNKLEGKGGGGTTEGGYHGGVDRGHASANGEQRREAEFGSGGYGAGPNANGVHTGGAWSGGSGDRHGKFAKDAGASDKWSDGGRGGEGVEGAERVDAQRQHGYDSASYGQERRRGQEVRQRNDRRKRGGRLFRCGVAQNVSCVFCAFLSMYVVRVCVCFLFLLAEESIRVSCQSVEWFDLLTFIFVSTLKTTMHCRA